MITRTSATIPLHLWNLDDFLHSLHCEHPSLWHNWMFTQSDDELNLRHLHVLVRQELLEQELHEHRDDGLHSALLLDPLYSKICGTGTNSTVATRPEPHSRESGWSSSQPFANVHAVPLKHVPAPKYLHKRMGRNSAPTCTAPVPSLPLLSLSS